MKKLSVYSLVLFLSFVLTSNVLAKEKVCLFSIIGASLSQENLVDSVFNNAGNYTFFLKKGNSVKQEQGIISIASTESEYRDTPTLWIKGFGGEGKVDVDVFEENKKYKSTYYGAIVGLDFDRKYTDGFDATYGFFMSYINNELNIDKSEDIKLKQEMGFVGVRGNLYFGRLFFSGIINYGLSFNKTEQTDDSSDFEKFNSSIISVAGKVGYNFEVAEKSFTIQPNIILTGSYIFIMDDIKKESRIDDIRKYTAEPGLKLVKTLGRCWILSGEGRYVVEKFEKQIEDDICYGNYTNLGLGIEKIWGYTVLNIKATKTLGATDGYIVNAGIELKF